MKTAKAVPVLMYHHVSPAPGLVTLTPEHFRAQMRHLARNGWNTIGLDDLARFLGGEPMPEKSVVITFDDGYLDNWVYAHPIMIEHGLHGVIFLITGRIGDGPARPHAGMANVPATPAHRDCMAAIAAGRSDEVMLRWSEVAAMREAGSFEFHSHTHSHTRWDRVEPDPFEREARLAEDLDQSRAALAHHLGTASDHLCWPQGYYDPTYIATARRRQFSWLYTTRWGTNTPQADPAAIRRIVAKDKGGLWLAARLAIFRRPVLADVYASVH